MYSTIDINKLKVECQMKKVLKKSDLPKHFWIAFILMILFWFLYIVSMVVSTVIQPGTVNMNIFQILPFVCISLGVIFLIAVAVILVVEYVKAR